MSGACSIVDCRRPAAFALGGYEFCARHKPPEAVTRAHVAEAREMMRRYGWSLAAIAKTLRVIPADLDRALWSRIGGLADTPTSGGLQ